jgi:hypothetical protein
VGVSKQTSPGEDRNKTLQLQRRSQVRGSMLLAGAALLFAILRAGVHHVFGPGWWRLW